MHRSVPTEANTDKPVHGAARIVADETFVDLTHQFPRFMPHWTNCPARSPRSPARHGPDRRPCRGRLRLHSDPRLASVDEYLQYRDRPAHRAVVAGLFASFITQRAAVHYRIDI